MVVRVQLPPRVQRGNWSPVMYYVYILSSFSRKRYYIGYSEFPDKRLTEHNSGKVKSTRLYRPWVKVYVEKCDTELLAIRREREIKSKKSRAYIEWLIGNVETRPDESRDG